MLIPRDISIEWEYMKKSTERTCIKCKLVFSGSQCKACKKAIAAAYYLKKSEKIHAVNAIWKAVNADRYKATTMARLEKNKDHIRVVRAEYHAKNKEALNLRSKEWRENNPQQACIQQQNYRARKRMAGGALSKDLAKRLFTLQKGKCPCCGRSLGDDYHLDHIVPLALGGSNTDDNMQLLTQRCNNQKHAKHPADFMRERGFLI